MLAIDTRATGIKADGSLWVPPYHWFVMVTGRFVRHCPFIGGVN
jgi:hypothetical protein